MMYEVALHSHRSGLLGKEISYLSQINARKAPCVVQKPSGLLTEVVSKWSSSR